MVDKKISELNALTAPASDDVFAIADISENETKKIAFSDIESSIGITGANVLTVSGKATEAISKGQAVYISGAVGENAQFSLADNTIDAKTDVVGLAAQTVTSGQTLLVRIAGQLINWDTSSWLDGDHLYLSTSGNLTKTEPTSGIVIHVADVENSHAINGDVLLHIVRSENKGAAANTNLFTRLGDNAGANKISYRDYANNEVAAIDSDGNITTAGLVDGIDIATDVAANTLKVTNATHTGEVTGSAALTIANDAVTYAKMQNVSATDKVLGRSTAGAGDVEEIACTAAGRALIDDANAAAQLATLGAMPIAGGTFTGAAEAADHGTAATDQIVNVCYGTGNPPTANTTTEGALFVKYTA